MDKLQSEFRENGVVFVERALDADAVRLAEKAFNWSLNNPGPGARNVLAGTPGGFYQDHSNPRCFDAYRELLCDTNVANLIAGLLGCDNLWLLYEQIWLKEGGSRQRTPWHQDLPYIPLEGEDLAVLWTCLDVVAQENSLEFVRGSHRGPLFNPTAFKADDPSAAMFADGVWPSLPDIESKRDSFPVVSWAVRPGDAIIFHPAILHGGAPTRQGERRRTLSLRFFGDRAFCAERPDAGLADVDRLTYDDGGADPMKEMARAKPGTLFRHSKFPKLRSIEKPVEPMPFNGPVQ
jgi:ectoine hydroxylase-related dioxygenase (phytanoyl-CoA dioxygenase family)